MIFWIDAQLPPTLAIWLDEAFAVQAVPYGISGFGTRRMTKFLLQQERRLRSC